MKCMEISVENLYVDIGLFVLTTRWNFFQALFNNPLSPKVDQNQFSLNNMNTQELKSLGYEN